MAASSNTVGTSSSAHAAAVHLQVKKPRKCFTGLEDLCILREVATTKPFGDEAKWITVLEDVKRVIGREVTLRGVKDRVDLLLGYWRQQDTRNLKKSGTEEEYTEKKQILQDISDYARAVNYRPKITPRSAGTQCIRTAVYNHTITPTQGGADACWEGGAAGECSTSTDSNTGEANEPGSPAARLLLYVYDQPKLSPPDLAADGQTSDQHPAEIEGENPSAANGSQQHWPSRGGQSQQHCLMNPDQGQQSTARQHVQPAMTGGIRGLQSTGQELLRMRETCEYELRQKELENEKRKLDNEERRLALEERKLDLEERKHQFEVSRHERAYQNLLEHIQKMFHEQNKKISELLDANRV